MIAWHYTTADRAALVLEDGELRPAAKAPPSSETDAQIDALQAGSPVRPVVWFTTRGTWEPTAAMKREINRWTGATRFLSVDELVEMTGGLVRFGVDAQVVPNRMNHYVRTGGISRRDARGLVKIAEALGSDPSSWRVSYAAIPRSMWQAVEGWDGARWVDLAEIMKESA